MKKLTSLAAVSMLLMGLALLSYAPAAAATLYFTDFNTGFSDWTVSGSSVTAETTHVISGSSVHILNVGSITRVVSTVGYSSISVTTNLAAGLLETGDFCYAEYNTGSGWVVMQQKTDGQDDYTFTAVTVNNISGADDNPNFQIRYRGQDSTADHCYAEDTTVSGTAGAATNTPTPTNTPSGPTPTPTNTPTGGSTVPGDPLTGDGNVTRTLLTYSDLTTASNPSAPVDDSAFAVPANAAMPLHTFEGHLILNNEATSGGFLEIRDDFLYTNAQDSPRKHLPEFDFQFVQNGSHLIPATQGLSITGHQFWNYIIGTGRAWKENSDNGYSRAAFPFTLNQRNSNCVHNGEMTLLFNASTVSNVRYQITQETCVYFKFDLWGQLSATYTPGAVPNATTLKNDHATEVANRLPTKPISALTTDFPGSGVNVAQFGSGVTAAHMTQYGLYINGTNYIAGCGTRYGTYAFCADMRMPSYSTAKTAFASVALMRLGQLNGESTVYNQLIKNYVSEYTLGGVWTNVTFNNTIDMATGNYRLAGYESDEGGTYEDQFFLAETYTDKITNAFDDFPSKVAPGTKWVYHSHDTFIVARAMNNYLGSDIFNKVRDDVYIPIKMSKGGLTTVRTDNSATGSPFGGYGLFYNRDDVAKLIKLFNNDHGMINGTQVLNANMLDDGMQKDATDRGLDTTGNPVFKYNNALWAKNMTPAEFPQYTCSFWIPFMSGYGGITIAMLPNGATYWYFSDNEEYSWYNAVNEADKLIHECP